MGGCRLEVGVRRVKRHVIGVPAPPPSLCLSPPPFTLVAIVFTASRLDSCSRKWPLPRCPHSIFNGEQPRSYLFGSVPVPLHRTPTGGPTGIFRPTTADSGADTDGMQLGNTGLQYSACGRTSMQRRRRPLPPGHPPLLVRQTYSTFQVV